MLKYLVNNTKNEISFKKLLVIALIFKLIFSVYFSVVNYFYTGGDNTFYNIFFLTKDYIEYLSPVENLVDNFEYSVDYRGENAFAFRMPAYVPTYGFLYWLLGPVYGKVALVFLNILMDALSCVFVYKITKKLFGSNLSATISFMLYTLLWFISYYNNMGLAETPSTFASIAGVYFIVVLYGKTKNNKYLLISGLFFTWAVFFRQSNLLIYATSFLIVFSSFKDLLIFSKYGSYLKKGVIYLLPFIIFDGIWVLRNQINYGEFIPLSNIESMYFKGREDNFVDRHFITQIGGSFMKLPYHEGSWFRDKKHNDYDLGYYYSNPFSPGAFTEDYNIDSLKLVRKHMELSVSDTLSEDQKAIYKAKYVEQFKRYTQSHKEKGSVIYYFTSRIKLCFRFVFVTQVYGSPFNQLDLFSKLNKLYSISIYYVCLLGFIVGAFYSVLKRNYLMFVMFLITVIHIGFYVFGFGAIENRYLANIMPEVAVLAGVFGVMIKKVYDKKIAFRE